MDDGLMVMVHGGWGRSSHTKVEPSQDQDAPHENIRIWNLGVVLVANGTLQPYMATVRGTASQYIVYAY